MKVLIVDDEKLIVDDLSHEVNELFPKASVDTAYDAGDALSHVKEKDYDVALLDIDLPGMDGLNLARNLIAALPAINIIFVTGYKEFALEAHELYCSAFLLKPVGKRKLKQAFENLRKPFVDLPDDFLAEHYQGSALIGKHIESLRKQRNISGQELADLMGVTRQTIYRWENGERFPDILTFLKLSRLLGSDIDELLK